MGTKRILVVTTISHEWYESNDEQLAKAIRRGYKVQHNLTGGYCLLVNQMLKETGSEIAIARKQGNVDKVIELLVNAKNLKRFYKEQLENVDTHIYIKR
jgi:hypothetical protein